MRSLGLCASLLILLSAGCGGTPSKSEVEQRVRAALPAASADWKNIQFETRADDTVYVVLASREVNGKTYEYSCTKGNDTDGAGVAVRGQGGEWLAKYHYENEKEDDAKKMSGTDEDVKNLRSTAAELATVVMKASR